MPWLLLVILPAAISIVFWQMFRVDRRTPEPGRKPRTRWLLVLLLLLLTPFILIALFLLMASLGYAPGPD
jgi:hypothetical protein